jgi:hypothetical protein
MRQLMLLFVLFAGGCIGNTPLPLVDPGMPANDPPGAVLIHVPGTSGNTFFDKNWTDALVDGGLNVTVEHFEWTRDDKRHLTALHAVDDNKKGAQPLADRITHLRRAQPKRKIILTSQSGGPMIAVWALEKLPPDVQVDTLVMLNPAISSSYDLTSALAHVRGNVYCFTSVHDWLYLGLGTRVAGLMDGQYGGGAGQAGFKRPDGASAVQYDKLVQIEYRFSWLKYGNFGHHTGALSPFMAKNYISPLIQTDMLPQ